MNEFCFNFYLLKFFIDFFYKINKNRLNYMLVVVKKNCAYTTWISIDLDIPLYCMAIISIIKTAFYISSVSHLRLSCTAFIFTTKSRDVSKRAFFRPAKFTKKRNVSIRIYINEKKSYTSGLKNFSER